MREIKFRQAIFHPITGEFVRWHYWGLIDRTFVGIDTGWYTPIKAVENSYEYTGLKDKNGKEIYEEDKVRYYTYDDYIGISIVEFRDGCFCPVAHPEQRLGMRYDEQQGFEVIGNIYENNELLKEVK